MAASALIGCHASAMALHTGLIDLIGQSFMQAWHVNCAVPVGLCAPAEVALEADFTVDGREVVGGRRAVGPYCAAQCALRLFDRPRDDM